MLSFVGKNPKRALKIESWDMGTNNLPYISV